jgi:hypothetical protein
VHDLGRNREHAAERVDRIVVGASLIGQRTREREHVPVDRDDVEAVGGLSLLTGGGCHGDAVADPPAGGLDVVEELDGGCAGVRRHGQERPGPCELAALDVDRGPPSPEGDATDRAGAKDPVVRAVVLHVEDCRISDAECARILDDDEAGAEPGLAANGQLAPDDEGADVPGSVDFDSRPLFDHTGLASRALCLELTRLAHPGHGDLRQRPSASLVLARSDQLRWQRRSVHIAVQLVVLRQERTLVALREAGHQTER